MKDAMRVGFVGLGNMGTPMATNLAQAGLRPLVHDLRREAVEAVVAHGAEAARSLQQVVAECDVVATCVLYDHQVRDIFLGPGGILEGGRAGQVATIHSTVMPQTVQDIAARGAERGIGIVDAAVSGGSARARQRDLTLMVGADDWAFERVRPLLEIVGSEVIRVGPPGAGQVVKLGNNIMTLCNQVIHMEAIRFVEAFGVSREALDRVAKVGTGGSWAQANYDHFDRYGVEHTLAGTPELPHRLGKDLRYAVGVAQEKWTYLPTVALCSQLLPGLFEARWARNRERDAAGGDGNAAGRED